MAANIVVQFILLIYKNLLLQWRKKCVTIMEILIPSLMMFLVAALRVLFTIDTTPLPSVYLNSIPVGSVTNYESTTVAFVPDTAVTQKLMQLVTQSITVKLEGTNQFCFHPLSYFSELISFR